MAARLPPSVLLTILLVAISAPHAAEDFQFGEFSGRAVDPAIPAAALGLLYATQVAGAYLAALGKRSGFICLMVAALVWAAGAVILHVPEMLAPGVYRRGIESKSLEVANILLGVAVAFACAIELRRRKGAGRA